MNKIDLIQQISSRANWAHEIPLYIFLKEFSVDSLETINGFEGYKFTSFINLMSQEVIVWRERKYKYYKEVEKMNFDEKDLLVKLFSQCYIDSETNRRNTIFVWRLFSDVDKLDLIKIEYITKKISEFDFKYSDMDTFYEGICDCAKNEDITIDDLESIFNLTTKIVNKKDKEIFKTFNGCFNYDMFNLDKDGINKLMDLFNNVEVLNSNKKPTKKDYENLEELFAFTSAILESNNNIDEVQLNILIQEWKKLPVRHIKYNFIQLINNENFTITNGDDVYLMRKIIFRESKNAFIDLECKIFNHKSFKELPFEQKNSIIDKLISFKSESAKQNYAEKVIAEIYKENAKKSAEEKEMFESVINFNESITLGELLDNIALNISSTHDTSYIDNSVALGYKKMDNKDIEDIINNFRDDNGDIDLERPIYYVTKNKVKAKKKN